MLLSENKDILTIYLGGYYFAGGLSLCLQQFQSVFVSEKNWQKKACFCMLEKINELPKLEESGSKPIDQEVVEFDHGADLWKSWDRVWLTQLKRGLKGVTPTERRTPTFYKERGIPTRPPKPENKLVPKQKKGTKFPVHPGRGKTRHPLAFDVSINEESEELSKPKQENHVDFYAGNFSRIPSGKLSIWVPYAEEQRVVEVEHDFWMGQYLITQEVYTQVMGANPSFMDGEGLGSQENLPVNNVSGWMQYPFAKH
jgi:hypothetical protein